MVAVRRSRSGVAGERVGSVRCRRKRHEPEPGVMRSSSDSSRAGRAACRALRGKGSSYCRDGCIETCLTADLVPCQQKMSLTVSGEPPHTGRTWRVGELRVPRARPHGRRDVGGAFILKRVGEWAAYGENSRTFRRSMIGDLGGVDGQRQKSGNASQLPACEVPKELSHHSLKNRRPRYEL